MKNMMKNMMKNKVFWVFLSVAVLSLTGVVIFKNFQQVRSANLTSVSITLSNSRPSFRGALAAGNTAGASQVIINTTDGAWASTSAAQLVEGDTVLIGEAQSLGSYTVTDVVDASTFNVTPVLAAGDADAADDVVSTSSAVLTARFTTANAIANGSFRILLPADSVDAEAKNGIADSGGFDYGTTTPTVTCPSNITGYNFTGGSSSAPSSVTLNGTKYHAYTCSYTGAGAIGTAFNGSTNGAIVITSIINPAPKKASHTIGYADAYRPIIQHLNNSGTVVDSTTISIGTVEAVSVTAEVAPQITFRIIGVDSGTTVCGQATSVTTTPSTVPFGELSIDSFIYAAQGLSVSTNAVNGYTVTAVANDQMGKDGVACAGNNGTGLVNCIQDPTGNTDTMAINTSDEWTNTTKKGFAYSLQDVNATTTEAFAYNESSRAFSARQFADASASESPVQIFSDNTVADNDNLYVCYKAIIPATQAAGNYSNYLTYTATASF